MTANWVEANKINLLEGERNNLAAYIASKAIVRDPQEGYVLIESVNHIVSPNLLRGAAEIATGLFINRLPQELKPDIVVGIPNRGKEFGAALGIMANLPIAISERVEFEGASDNNEIWVERDSKANTTSICGIHSFTKKNKIHRHIIYGLQEGQKVLFADDFCARGEVTQAYLKVCQQLGIIPIFTYMVAKDFADLEKPQIGYRKALEQGVPAFAVVTLTGLRDGLVSVSSNFEKQLMNKGL